MTRLNSLVLLLVFAAAISACSGGSETQSNEGSSQQSSTQEGSAQDSVAEEVSEGDPPSDSMFEKLIPIRKLEEQLYGDELEAVVEHISTFSPTNLQIVSACVFASNIYRQDIIPHHGDGPYIELGSPSAAAAEEIHKVLLELAAGYKAQLDDNEAYSALLKLVNEEGMNHFLPKNDDGMRYANMENWSKWYGVPLVSPCRNIAAPFLEEGVDPMGIVRE